MTDDQQADDDEMARIVGALEEAGLVETYERPDGTVAVRLSERGEELREALPKATAPPGAGEDDVQV